ncbi:DUF5050 domain-containing protein [Peribacillus simplex]|uniref:DUF5050 domain-containing protein n=1 Tax=Peribacillus simplex TaxID=1478 RepID=UPI0007ABE3FC|nr:DUF5050 domain-containing protein [Peribacillus simplex]MEC1399975.1 DUF5050 domain-containing protein [Peribacillus simplex]
MSLNGENIKKLNDTVSYIQIIDDADEQFLYYTDTEDHLYKVDKQNGKEMKITDQKFSSLIVDENWIYYLNPSDHYHVYKMKKNGEQNQLLMDKEVSDINELDNWIYYKIMVMRTSSELKRMGKEIHYFQSISRCLSLL